MAESARSDEQGNLSVPGVGVAREFRIERNPDGTIVLIPTMSLEEIERRFNRRLAAGPTDLVEVSPELEAELARFADDTPV